MKKLALVSVLVATAGLINVGCSAQGSIRTTSTAQPGASAPIAYTTAPVKGAKCPSCPDCK